MPDNFAKPSPAHFARICSACEAPVELSAVTCWLCGEKLGPHGAPLPKWVAAAQRPRPMRQTPESMESLSLTSWLMLVTLICVVFGVFAIAPGLGVPLAVVALIGWVATVDTVRLRRQQGHAAKGFVATLALVVVAGVASMIAFLATCIASVAVSVSLDRSSPERYGGMAIGAAIGLSGGVWLAGYLYRRFTGQNRQIDSDGETL